MDEGFSVQTESSEQIRNAENKGFEVLTVTVKPSKTVRTQ